MCNTGWLSLCCEVYIVCACLWADCLWIDICGVCIMLGRVVGTLLTSGSGCVGLSNTRERCVYIVQGTCVWRRHYLEGRVCMLYTCCGQVFYVITSNTCILYIYIVGCVCAVGMLSVSGYVYEVFILGLVMGSLEMHMCMCGV